MSRYHPHNPPQPQKSRRSTYMYIEHTFANVNVGSRALTNTQMHLVPSGAMHSIDAILPSRGR